MNDDRAVARRAHATAMRRIRYLLRAAQDAQDIARDALRRVDSACVTLGITLSQAYPLSEFDRQ